MAEKKRSGVADGKWTARAGVAVAGCTDPTEQGMYRESIYTDGRPAPLDKGYWC
ncbi:hypothetical protein [Brevundimonas sp.]|uniref:hypothetical protein n=1 Tax=Brevundimonas sp. TaxID=1871086 RepID=UPI002D3307B2|nr:hypothetical protein [Brevundimonas sp.]HYC99259.1 hypothetical protein [Brevundimonas sp.]